VCKFKDVPCGRSPISCNTQRCQDLELPYTLMAKSSTRARKTNITDDDAVKRDALRRDGKRFWSIKMERSTGLCGPQDEKLRADRSPAGCRILPVKPSRCAPEDVVAEPNRTCWWVLVRSQADVWPRWGRSKTVIGLVNPPGKHGTAADPDGSLESDQNTKEAKFGGNKCLNPCRRERFWSCSLGRSGYRFTSASTRQLQSHNGVWAVSTNRLRSRRTETSERWRDWLRCVHVLQS